MSLIRIGEVLAARLPAEPPEFAIVVDSDRRAWQRRPPARARSGGSTSGGWHGLGTFMAVPWSTLALRHGGVTVVWVPVEPEGEPS